MFKTNSYEIKEIFPLFIHTDACDKYPNLRKYIKQIWSSVVPDFTPNELNSVDFVKSGFGYLDARGEITNRIGFVLVDKQWTKLLSNYIGNKNVLEIMSGCGFLAKALMDHGVNLIPTDDFSWDRQWAETNRYYGNIEKIDAIKAIEKYGAKVDYILMSWAYMDDTAYKCLLKMREINPNCKMIVIGEGEGGCTASDEFFEELIMDDNQPNINIPQWHGIHDELIIIK